MNRRSSIGALHPVFFLITVYLISVVMALFVCNVVYKGIHQSSTFAAKGVSKLEGLTALK